MIRLMKMINVKQLTDGDMYLRGDVAGEAVMGPPTGVPKETGTGTVSKPGAESSGKMKHQKGYAKCGEEKLKGRD